MNLNREKLVTETVNHLMDLMEDTHVLDEGIEDELSTNLNKVFNGLKESGKLEYYVGLHLASSLYLESSLRGFNKAGVE